MRASLQLGGKTVDGNPGTNLHRLDGQGFALAGQTADRRRRSVAICQHSVGIEVQFGRPKWQQSAGALDELQGLEFAAELEFDHLRQVHGIGNAETKSAESGAAQCWI